MNTGTLEATETKTRKARSANGAALRAKIAKLTLTTANNLDSLTQLIGQLDQDGREKVSVTLGEAYDDFVTAATTTKTARTLEL